MCTDQRSSISSQPQWISLLSSHATGNNNSKNIHSHYTPGSNNIRFHIVFADWNGDGRGVWSDGMKISGTWTWSFSSSATWFNWNVNEPSGNGICTQLYRTVFRIDDLQCDYQSLQYVCEKSLDA